MTFARRWLAMAALGGAALFSFLGWSGAAAPGADKPAAYGGSTHEAARKAARLREGAVLVDQPGLFQTVGDRLVFVFEGENRRLTALENLALERVAQAVRQSASPQTWIISGTVTEYQGTNFLLLDRAVIRRAAESAR